MKGWMLAGVRQDWGVLVERTHSGWIFLANSLGAKHWLAKAQFCSHQVDSSKQIVPVYYNLNFDKGKCENPEPYFY